MFRNISTKNTECLFITINQTGNLFISVMILGHVTAVKIYAFYFTKVHKTFLIFFFFSKLCFLSDQEKCIYFCVDYNMKITLVMVVIIIYACFDLIFVLENAYSEPELGFILSHNMKNKHDFT